MLSFKSKLIVCWRYWKPIRRFAIVDIVGKALSPRSIGPNREFFNKWAATKSARVTIPSTWLCLFITHRCRKPKVRNILYVRCEYRTTRGTLIYAFNDQISNVHFIYGSTHLDGCMLRDGISRAIHVGTQVQPPSSDTPNEKWDWLQKMQLQATHLSWSFTSRLLISG